MELIIIYFQTNMGQRKSDRIIRVRKVEQLEGNLLPATQATYQLENIFDPSFTITVPDGGLSFSGTSFDTSGFKLSGNNVLFDGSFTGNILFTDIKLSKETGATGNLFDTTSSDEFGAMEFNRVNFGEFDSSDITGTFGNITDFRQLLFAGCGFARYDDGFTLNGPMSGGVTITNSIVLFAQSGSTLFKEGTSLTMDSIRSNLNALSGTNNDNYELFDFDENNIVQDEGFNLEGLRAKPGTNPIPNITAGNRRCYWRNCINIDNTSPGGRWTITTETTTALTTDTPAKIAGTTTYELLEHFDSNGSTNNSLRYISTIPKFFVATFKGTLVSGSAGDVISVRLRHWDDSASTYIELAEDLAVTSATGAFGAGVILADFTVSDVLKLDENDRIEVWGENQSDGSDVTFQDDSSLIVSVRN